MLETIDNNGKRYAEIIWATERVEKTTFFWQNAVGGSIPPLTFRERFSGTWHASGNPMPFHRLNHPFNSGCLHMKRDFLSPRTTTAPSHGRSMTFSRCLLSSVV